MSGCEWVCECEWVGVSGGVFQGKAVFVICRLNKHNPSPGSCTASELCRAPCSQRVSCPLPSSAPACVPVRAAARGQLLTEHGNVALEEGAPENEPDFVTVIGSDKSGLRVIKALGPVLELIEVSGHASVWRNGDKGRCQAGGVRGKSGLVPHRCPWPWIHIPVGGTARRQEGA